MKKLYSAELWNRGSRDSRYITPQGLVKDLPCMDENYLWESREEANQAIMEESSKWYDPWGVQAAIRECDVEGSE